MNKTCYCGSLLTPKCCCLKFLSGEENPKTAQELMRSRYTAFVLKNKTYLVKTWYKKKNQDIGDQLFDDNIQWISLEVIATKKGLVNDNTGLVEFRATFELNGKQTVLHENSQFKKEKGLWFYVKGEHK